MEIRLATLNSTCSYIERVSCPSRVLAGNVVKSNQCIDAQHVLSIDRRHSDFKCIYIYTHIHTHTNLKFEGYIYIYIYICTYTHTPRMYTRL